MNTIEEALAMIASLGPNDPMSILLQALLDLTDECPFDCDSCRD